MIEATKASAGHWEATRYTHTDERELDSVLVSDGKQGIEIDLADIPCVVELLQQALR